MPSDSLTPEDIRTIDRAYMVRSEGWARDLRRVVTAWEVERDRAERAEAERDALQAMVDCCRELVLELPYAAQNALAEIVGWPAEVAEIHAATTTADNDPRKREP